MRAGGEEQAGEEVRVGGCKDGGRLRGGEEGSVYIVCSYVFNCSGEILHVGPLRP